MIHSFAFSFRLQDDAHPVVEQASEADVLPLDDVVFSDDEQVFLVLVGVHRRVGNQGRLVLVAHGNADAHAGAGDQPAVGVVGDAADEDRAGALGVLVVGENEMALVRKALLRVQAEAERDLLLAERLLLVLARPAGADLLITLHRPFVDVEIHVDRVDGDDRRQQRIAPAGVDEVAFAEIGLADLAGQIGGDLRVLKIELVAFYLLLQGRNAGVIGVRVGLGFIESCRLAAPVLTNSV